MAVTLGIALGIAAVAVAAGGAAYQAVSSEDHYQEQKKIQEEVLKQRLAQEGILTEQEKRKKELEINLLERAVFDPGTALPVTGQAATPAAASPKFSLPDPDTLILYGGSALLCWMAYKAVRNG